MTNQHEDAFLTHWLKLYYCMCLALNKLKYFRDKLTKLQRYISARRQTDATGAQKAQLKCSSELFMFLQSWTIESLQLAHYP